MKNKNIIVCSFMCLIVTCIQSMDNKYSSSSGGKKTQKNQSLLSMALLSLSHPVEIVSDHKGAKEDIFSPRQEPAGIPRNVAVSVSYEPEDSLAAFCNTYNPPVKPQCHLSHNSVFNL